MALELINGVVVPDTPTLHRHDGSKFYGDCAVQDVQIDYDRRNPEIIFLADGTRAFSEVGDPQRWINGFTLYIFKRVAMQQINNNIADETTEGIFQLEVPDTIDGTGGGTFDIRFLTYPAWSKVSLRRQGYPEIWSAEVTEVDVF